MTIIGIAKCGLRSAKISQIGWRLALFATGLNLVLANTAWASVCEEIHNQLSRGQKVSPGTIIDSLNAELQADSKNPFKHFVAAELLISLGLYEQAEAQFADADRLRKNFVQTKFHEELKERHHTLRLICPYLQKTQPDDPALLYYLASRDLAGLELKQDPNKVTLLPIIDEFNQAAAVANPWVGTFGELSMLEYNEAMRNTSGDYPKLSKAPSKEELLALSIKHAREELKRDPSNALANKVLMLAMIQSGGSLEKMENTLLKLIKTSPADRDLYLLLARIYLSKKDYNTAIRPALVCLLLEPADGKRDSGRYIYHDLVRNANPNEVAMAAIEILKELGGNDHRAYVLCLKVADLLVAAEKTTEALRLLVTVLPVTPPDLRMMYNLRIGQYLTRIHHYDQACVHLDQALQICSNASVRNKIMVIRNRVASLRNNFDRDLAVQIKVGITALSSRM